jgi:hypothetical protein
MYFSQMLAVSNRQERPVEEPFRIEIAEDHTILREDLNALFFSQTDLNVVGEAGDGLVKG